ncbi:MAG: polysulfide reductase NrfD [Candidatus Eremiobacteraeota bacterium]|nr:polysulfide reductase NrfD [Candidatus Eremiobacteraeota bacterium]
MRNVARPDDAFGGASDRDEFPASPTYFERPLLKAPHWEWNIVTYLFLGGIMGGLGLIAALCDSRDVGDRRLRRIVRFASLALAAANPAILISHLGRPERFLNMLRIVKVKSPMSLGVWGLVLYSTAATATAVRELAEMRALPPQFRCVAPEALNGAQALLGAFLAGYTGVLLSATANPFWASGKRHIPAACVASGAAGACALAGLLCEITGNHRVRGKLEALEMVSGAAELLILTDFSRRAGAYAAPMFSGTCGRRLRIYTTIGGTLVPIALNTLGRAFALPKNVDAIRTIAASLLTLVGGYVFRLSLIDAGKASAGNPRAASRQPK